MRQIKHQTTIYQNQAFLEGRGKSISITTPHPWASICNEHHKSIFFGNMAPFKSVLTNTQPRKIKTIKN